MLNLLGEDGADITAYDPAIAEPIAQLPGTAGAADPVEAARGADVLVVLTEWPEFRDVDLVEVADVMAHRNIVDARNLLDRARLDALGFTVLGVGR